LLIHKRPHPAHPTFRTIQTQLAASPEYEPPPPIPVNDRANPWAAPAGDGDSPGLQIAQEFRATVEQPVDQLAHIPDVNVDQSIFANELNSLRIRETRGMASTNPHADLPNVMVSSSDTGRPQLSEPLPMEWYNTNIPGHGSSPSIIRESLAWGLRLSLTDLQDMENRLIKFCEVKFPELLHTPQDMISPRSVQTCSSQFIYANQTIFPALFEPPHRAWISSACRYMISLHSKCSSPALPGSSSSSLHIDLAANSYFEPKKMPETNDTEMLDMESPSAESTTAEDQVINFDVLPRLNLESPTLTSISSSTTPADDLLVQEVIEESLSSNVLPDIASESLESKRQLKAASYDPSTLDSFLASQSQPDTGIQPSPHELAKTQVWGHIDPRVKWPKEHSEEWLAEKRREIESRGGRKANFGRLLTTQVVKERRDNGWGIHQTKDVVDDERSAEGARALEELLGLKGLDVFEPGLRNGQLVMIEKAADENGKKKRKGTLRVYPVG